MDVNIKIADVLFGLSLDNDVARYFLKRVHKVEVKSLKKVDVKVICQKEETLIFNNSKFINQQEPDIEELFLYREIFDLGIFKYHRKERILEAHYIDTDRYVYNSFEVVVDTLLQFIYLIMLDFNVIPLHASVVTYKDNAILLFGNSGSGKTTLELALLYSGFRFFSDDIAFFTQNNVICNSSEYIIACSQKTTDIIATQFKMDYLYNNTSDMTGKHMIQAPNNLICEYTKVNPSVIIFPTLTKNKKETFEKISSKSAWIKLIQLSISKQFDSLQKELYMKRLKILSEKTIAFQYHRTNNSENILIEICNNMKNIYEISEVYS